MSEPAKPLVALPLVDVLRADARFRCAPYACTLSASACITRQKQASTGDPKYSLCRNCADGQVVSRQVTTGIPELRLCSRAKCGTPVHEDGPLCLVHMRSVRAVAASTKARKRPPNAKQEEPPMPTIPAVPISDTLRAGREKMAAETAVSKPAAVPETLSLTGEFNRDFALVMLDVLDIIYADGGIELLRALARTLRKGKCA